MPSTPRPSKTRPPTALEALRPGSKILVANRGEIACRILATLRAMEIPGVAVYTDADRDAPHVFEAPAAYPLGSNDGYLSPERILAAAAQSGASAIHPGYGFLSQNAAFAEAVAKAGLVFIGPSPQAMLALGEKRAARAAAEKAGVPVIPGTAECETVAAASAAARRLGYPVLLKAAGGGGGKGMRTVSTADEMAAAFAAAQREAEGAFGDRRLLLEKLIQPARHIEVQVLADGKQAIALGERECSLQRRYQKVIEESPAPRILDSTRDALAESAVALARTVGYANAGTVEFLVGPDGAHAFLEVNTRLQVEHPVTEMRFGLDLVRAQIEIAHGGPLPVAGAPRGHAIEARIYAEDPTREFLPTTGRILDLAWPHHPWVRIDAGIAAGQEVTPFYDPLLAKVIAWGSDREEARRRLVNALRDTVLLGLTTNQGFLLDILTSDFFVRGETTTTTLESTAWPAAAAPPEIVAAAATAMKSLAVTSGGARDGAGGGAMNGDAMAGTAGMGKSDRFSPWRTLAGFRLGGAPSGEQGEGGQRGSGGQGEGAGRRGGRV